jgi:hemerythrin-like domain-containing protein
MASSNDIRQPFPLLATRPEWKSDNHAEYCAIQMTLVHNLFIRAINSIYYHAPYVKEPQDINDFLKFCQTFASVMALHHETEETVIFPLWVEMTQKDDFMKENVDEHHAFHDGLVKLEGYSTNTAAADYRYEDLYTILDGFAPLLVSHLSSEIDTLLTLRDYPAEKVLEAWKAGEKAVGDHASNYEQIPFALGCHDATYEGGQHLFIPFPWFVKLMLHWWYGKKYAGAWRFCPSDLYSTPKRPVFGPDAS